ncbi:MAG: hypothetical protein ACU84J_08900 [Gammaproteobacteria bacterium]
MKDVSSAVKSFNYSAYRSGVCLTGVLFGLRGKIMDRYARISAAEKIDGYYNPPMCHDVPKRTPEEKFEEAKAETLRHMRKRVEDVENLTFSDFLAGRRGK